MALKVMYIFRLSAWQLARIGLDNASFPFRSSATRPTAQSCRSNDPLVFRIPSNRPAQPTLEFHGTKGTLTITRTGYQIKAGRRGGGGNRKVQMEDSRRGKSLYPAAWPPAFEMPFLPSRPDQAESDAVVCSHYPAVGDGGHSGGGSHQGSAVDRHRPPSLFVKT